jgi:ADP-heptose:LPS heptosyltransferase
MPDLPCDFHYEIPIAQEHRAFGDSLLEGLSRPLVGISAASYRGSEAWRTWGVEEWKCVLEWLKSELPGASIILLGGFWDDLTFTLARYGYHDLVGKTNTQTMIYILSQLDLYIGFSSGMGVLRTVMSKPVFMLWPEHQRALSKSWAPVEMLENHSYVASVWTGTDIAIPLLKNWLRSNL